MIKRTLYFGNPTYLSCRNEQLVIDKSNDSAASITIPIEDIGIVLLDHSQITVTHQTIRKLNDYQVAIVSCDEKHMPKGLMLPLYGHTLQSKRYRDHISISAPLKKNLWQQTIKSKIRNQSQVLQKYNLPNNRLEVLYNRVSSGDKENVEGQAAAYYWRTLFGDNFRRDREGSAPNHLLNYGYAFIRSLVARALIGSGLILSLGIHHKNQYNPYCLADDIMEPFRPFIDAIVKDIHQIHMTSDYMDNEIKAALMKSATVDALFGKNRRPLMVGVSYTTSSVYDCIIGKRKKIIYPELC